MNSHREVVWEGVSHDWLTLRVLLPFKVYDVWPGAFDLVLLLLTPLSLALSNGHKMSHILNELKHIEVSFKSGCSFLQEQVVLVNRLDLPFLTAQDAAAGPPEVLTELFDR